MRILAGYVGKYVCSTYHYDCKLQIEYSTYPSSNIDISQGLMFMTL